MAHYVGAKLHIRPNDILDGWGVPELIVAFGQYYNERVMESHEYWKHKDAGSRGSDPLRKRVQFITNEETEES